MKKKLALALAASFALATGSAFAAEVPNALGLNFDGNLTIQYRNDNVKFAGAKDGSHNGLKEIFTLNTTKKIGDVEVYARYTYENVSDGLKGNGYGSPIDYINTDYNGTIDAFGVKFKTGSWGWTVGSQSITIGDQGMIYDNGFIGKHALPYAVVGNGKVGAVDTTVLYARTNYQGGTEQDNFYGVQFSYDYSKNAKVGAFYTKWNNKSKACGVAADSMNFYGIDYSYQLSDKLSFAAEYAKSNASTDNKAYIGGFTYAMNQNDKVSVKYYRSEDLSGITDANFGNMTTAPNANTKGYIVSFKHKISKDTSMGLSHDNYSRINATAQGGTSNERARTVLSYGVNF